MQDHLKQDSSKIATDQFAISYFSAPILMALALQPFLFASNMVLARFAAGAFPPINLAFFRWLLALCLLLPWIAPLLWQERHMIKTEWHKFLILGTLGMGICGAFVYIAAQTTLVINIAVIYTSSPFFILIINLIFLKKPIFINQWIAFFLGLFGVLLVITKGQLQDLFALNFIIGDLWILAASISWAVYSILLQNWGFRTNQKLKLPLTIMGGVMILFPFSLFEIYLEGFPDFTLKTIMIIVFLALIASLAAYKLYNYLIMQIGSVFAGLTLYLAPIAAGFMGWLLLDETIHLYHFIGLFLVLSGIALINKSVNKSVNKSIK